MNYQMPMQQPMPGQAQPQVAPQYSTPPTAPGSYPMPMTQSSSGQQQPQQQSNPTQTQPIGMYNGGGVPKMFNQTQMNPGPFSRQPSMPPHIQQMNQKMQQMGHPDGGMMGKNMPRGMTVQNMPRMGNGDPRYMYAEGGSTVMGMPKPKGGFVLAHFSKSELPALDEAQGKTTYLPGTNIRHYKGLEHDMKNNHDFASHIHEGVRHLFEGGQIHQIRDKVAHMKHMGEHGDNEMALIGPHTKAVLDHMAGGGSINPHTGHPEYWSLGGILGGLGKAAGHVKKFLPAATGMMNMMPGGGGKFGQFMNAANGMMQGQGGGMGDMMSKIPGGGFMQKGMDFFNNNPYGQALKGMGQHFMENDPRAQQMKQRFQQGMQESNMPGRAQQFMNSPFGRNVMNAGRTAMDAYRGGEGFDRAAARGVSNFAQNFDNPYAHMARGMADQYSMPDQMGGGRGNIGRAAARGMDYASRGSSNPYAQMGGMMANMYANGPDQGYGQGQDGQQGGGGYSQGGYGNPAGMDQDMWDQL